MIKFLELLTKYKPEDLLDMFAEVQDSELVKGVTSKLTPEAFVKARAEIKYKQYQAYVDAGFTQEQAWELIE